MKLITFKKFVPTCPQMGQGMIAGTTALFTEYQVNAFKQMPKIKDDVDEYLDIKEVPEHLIYKGEKLPAGSSVGFFYPGGLGDAACHTAIIASFKNENPDVKIHVYARPGSGEIWFLNPCIEDRCAKPALIDEGLLSRHDKWLFGDGVVYNLTGKNQPNIYEVLGDHFHVQMEMKQRRPFMFVSEDEIMGLWTKITTMMNGYDMRDDQFLLFAPTASKWNRSWPADKYVEFVKRVREQLRFRVIAVGNGLNGQQMKVLNGHCDLVLINALTTRDLILLSHQASRIVTVDTALVHLGAAFEIPTIAMYGPFEPEMRVRSYTNCLPIYRGHVCKKAPCCFHDDGFPEGCPSADQGLCAVMNDVSVNMIMDELKDIGQPSKIVLA